MDSLQDPLALHVNRRLFDEVYNRMRSAIVTGYLQPGARVVEREITERLQVSRTPVREAMKQLEQEGLIVCYPHRGCFVRTPTFEEAKQAYEMRCMLEGFSAELAAQRATEPELAAMTEAIERSSIALRTGDRPAMLLSNNDFHYLMAKAARNQFLEEDLSRLWAYVDILRFQYWVTTDRATRSQEEHEAILAALRNRDVARARRLNEEHVMEAWDLIAARFREQAAPSNPR